MKTRIPPAVVAFFFALALGGCGDLQSPAAVAGAADLAAGGAGETWHVPGDFATIQAAIDAPVVEDGDVILVGAGAHAGAVVSKGVRIRGEDGAVINTGPVFFERGGIVYTYGFHLLDDHSGDGASISHLRFDGVAFPVYSRGANDVAVEHNEIWNPIQGITNWAGSGWQIEHNTIVDLRTLCGGGIGILMGDFAATGAGVSNNVVSHNDVQGVLHVSEGDCGGYDGTGIVLYADFRSGRSGATAITANEVSRNKIGLTSDNPGVVDVIALELTDTRDDTTLDPVIFGNAITFNDFRGTANQIVLTPSNLGEDNEIARNLGESRGRSAGQPSPIDGAGS